MKKIIYSTVCSLVLFSCSTTLNQASNDITIKEKIIKSITVKSKKDGYIIAKTGEIKQQFNFDTTLKSQDTFESEVEYLDGTKTNQVIWESSEKNDIAVENGVITGKKYSNVDIIVYNKTKSKKVIFKANFVNNLVIKEKEPCSDAEIINKYDYLYDIPKNEDVIEKDLGTIFNKTDDIKEKPTFNRTIKKTEIYNSFILKNYESIKERATFNGKVFDTSGFTIDDVKIEARSLDFCTEWVGIPQYTQSGAYVLRNTPVGVPIEITATKKGWTKRLRTEHLKSGGLSDPKANVFDFGNGNESRGTEPNNLYALQDEPEINMLKINGQIVTNSDTLNTKNIGITNSIKPDNLKANITGISSDLVTIEITFSESVNREDVENYFRITSQENIDSKKESFIINKKNTNLNFYWSEDTSNLKIDINNALLANKTGYEAKYMIDFEKPFRDSTNRYNLKNKTFRFSPSKINDFTIFSVKNKEIKK